MALAFASICSKCRNPLADECINVKGQSWHPDCFECFNCKKNLTDKPFFALALAVFCAKCHVRMYRQRCISCNGPIKTHAIKAMDVFWHSKCFRCTVCSSPLSQRFYLTKQKMPCCVACFQRDLDDQLRVSDILSELPPILESSHSLVPSPHTVGGQPNPTWYTSPSSVPNATTTAPPPVESPITKTSTTPMRKDGEWFSPSPNSLMSPIQSVDLPPPPLTGTVELPAIPPEFEKPASDVTSIPVPASTLSANVPPAASAAVDVQHPEVSSKPKSSVIASESAPVQEKSAVHGVPLSADAQNPTIAVAEEPPYADVITKRPKPKAKPQSDTSSESGSDKSDKS